jgi:rubrerythrin
LTKVLYAVKLKESGKLRGQSNQQGGKLMPDHMYKPDNTHWRCRVCGKTGDARISVPEKCPDCKSMDIYVPLIKKGGPAPRDFKKY